MDCVSQRKPGERPASRVSLSGSSADCGSLDLPTVIQPTIGSAVPKLFFDEIGGTFEGVEKPRPRSAGLLRFLGGTSDGSGGDRHR